MNMITVTIKILLGVSLLFGVTKFLGKTQITQITPFDFISSIVMGEMFIHAVFDKHTSLWMLTYVIVLWGVLMFAFEFLAMKFIKLRGFLEGSPSVLVRDGQIDRNQLKRNKMNINQLLNLLRQNNVFSITEVKYAILEMNGFLSVMKYAPHNTPTRQDLNLPDQPVYLPTTFISDGKVNEENLAACGFDRPWLENQLKTQGVNGIKDVFYGEWREDKGLSISRK